uniref:Uncharacterized protein n=1 Tax=Ditylenchus dipsaci TaxID=166011 RepID=A0A915EQA5_9BILA
MCAELSQFRIGEEVSAAATLAAGYQSDQDGWGAYETESRFNFNFTREKPSVLDCDHTSSGRRTSCRTDSNVCTDSNEVFLSYGNGPVDKRIPVTGGNLCGLGITRDSDADELKTTAPGSRTSSLQLSARPSIRRRDQAGGRMGQTSGNRIG